MSNPFHNPWSKSNELDRGYNGPVYGNAYEDDSNLNSVPSPNNGGFTNSSYHNAWGQQQTEYESPQNQDTYNSESSHYQYTSTSHNNDNYAGPYNNSPQPDHISPQPDSNRQSETLSNDSTGRFARNRVHEESSGLKPKGKPNKWRVLLRFIIFICSIGHLGFAAGARPYSGEDLPFSTTSCFYYLFAVAILSIVYSGYHLMYSCCRYASNKPKMNRPIMLGFDVLFAVLWGIGIIVEIAKYQCTWGGKFCAFYNVSIFWGFVAFVAYILSSFWDLVGGCK